MIAVVGLGFIGLTVALGFAEKGVEVYGVDIDDFRTGLIRNGKIPYFEPGLDEALERNLNNHFHVLNDLDDVPDGIECFFICAGSPEVRDGKPDHSRIFRAIDDIVDAGFEDYYTIAIKTTMIPGTMDEVMVPYLEEKGVELGVDCGLALNPEFMREGKCWHDFTNPSRIVIGVSNELDEEVLRRCYAPFDAPVVAANYATAEFIRYMSSTLLATMISYSNEMAAAAKAIGGIDISQAFRIAQMDGRWSENTMRGYVYPGLGFGGIFLPKDTRDFIQLANESGAEVPLLENVMAINEEIPANIAAEIASQVEKDARLGILGLTFKEGSGDVRNSASAKIIQQLQALGYDNICAYDPIANDDFAAAYHMDISYAFSLRELCDSCDVVIIATPWRQFKVVPEYAKGKPVFDCRYML